MIASVVDLSSWSRRSQNVWSVQTRGTDGQRPRNSGSACGVKIWAVRGMVGARTPTLPLVCATVRDMRERSHLRLLRPRAQARACKAEARACRTNVRPAAHENDTFSVSSSAEIMNQKQRHAHLTELLVPDVPEEVVLEFLAEMRQAQLQVSAASLWCAAWPSEPLLSRTPPSPASLRSMARLQCLPSLHSWRGSARAAREPPPRVAAEERAPA